MPCRITSFFKPTILCQGRGKLHHMTITLAAFTACVVFLSTDVIKRMDSFTTERNQRNAVNDTMEYLIDTSGCRIPYLDPLDHSVTKFINPYPPITCNFKPAMTFTDGMYLRMDESTMRKYYTHNLLHCEYQEIYRPQEGNDNVYHVNKTVVLFMYDIRVDCDFLRVVCFDKNYSMIYTNFHPFIRPMILNETPRIRDTARPNILIVGLDSVSRLNFLRQMPQTKAVLSQLGAFDLHGFNKVADNTLVNLLPMFTGKYLHDLQQNNWTHMDYFDDYKFVWKEFQNLGYKTLFGEDAPEISIFNYMKQGFKRPPMSYYLRPFSLAIEEYSNLWSNSHDCFRDIPETKIVLDWTKDFIRLYNNDPYFAFIFLTRLTHDNVNKAGAADALYAQFFGNLQKDGHLDNTVIFFFSDHGMRFGPVRQTHIGKLEERLPFFYVIVPETYKKLHKSAVSNMKLNQHRLTTPFDIYETLRSLAQNTHVIDKSNSQQKYGRSLFSLISEDRTCENAGVDPHWCTCHQTREVDVMDPAIVGASLTITTFINEKLYVVSGKCENLFLKGIRDALFLSGKNMTKAVRQYLVTVVLSPGDGLFEATVEHNLEGDQFVVLGEPSRINMYGDQGKCIRQHSLQKYCFCR